VNDTGNIHVESDEDNGTMGKTHRLNIFPINQTLIHSRCLNSKVATVDDSALNQESRKENQPQRRSARMKQFFTCISALPLGCFCLAAMQITETKCLFIFLLCCILSVGIIHSIILIPK